MSCVYFAEAGGYIKIGYSKDPFGRVGTITRCGKRPGDLPRGAEAALIGWIPGDTRTEGAYHARFIDQRVEGEWFRLARADVEKLIWDDPRGVVLDRMSMMAALVAHKCPDATRDQIEAAGVPIEATPSDLLDDVLTAFGGAA